MTMSYQQSDARPGCQWKLLEDRSEELINLTFGVVCVVWVLYNAVRCSQISYLEERVYLAVLKSQCAKHSSLCFCFLFAFIFVFCYAFRSMISYLEERVYLAAVESHCARHWSSIGWAPTHTTLTVGSQHSKLFVVKLVYLSNHR